MAGQEEDMTFAAAQAARIERIRQQVRCGVWGLRHEAALQAHWNALERGMRADSAVPEQDVAGSKCDAENLETQHNPTL